MITEFQVWNQYVAGGNRFQRLPLINQRFLHKLEKLLLNKPHSLLSRSMICLNKNLTAKELIPHCLWNLEPITHHIVYDIVKIILTVNEPITSVGMCWVLSKTLLWNYLRQLGIHNGEKPLLKNLTHCIIKKSVGRIIRGNVFVMRTITNDYNKIVCTLLHRKWKRLLRIIKDNII